MAHSFVCIYLHLVFSTKDRAPMIVPDKQRTLHRYMAGVARNHGMKAVSIGGMPDHIHLLVSVPSEMGAAKAVNVLKSNSSRWIRESVRGFSWQKGYAAFSGSLSALSSVVAYIENQSEHHKRRDFRQEYLAPTPSPPPPPRPGSA